jgi:hypothetical protein
MAGKSSGILVACRMSRADLHGGVPLECIFIVMCQTKRRSWITDVMHRRRHEDGVKSISVTLLEETGRVANVNMACDSWLYRGNRCKTKE